jgi:hypothetical protein
MEKRSTALQEQKDRSHIIKEYIRSLGLTRKSERKVPSKSKSRRGVKIHARVYGEHGLYGKGEQEITIIEREFAGTYGKIKGGPYVVKMGSTWYIGSNER